MSSRPPAPQRNINPQGGDFQPGKWLLFSLAHEQKGATSHDETEGKTRGEWTAEVEEGKKKIRQFENREKVLRQKLSQEERRERSHRRSVRGAAFEGIAPEARTMTDEEAAAFFRPALTSEEARACLKNARRAGKENNPSGAKGTLMRPCGSLRSAEGFSPRRERFPSSFRAFPRAGLWG